MPEDIRTGYDPEFLGSKEEFILELPTPHLAIENDVLADEEFRDEIYVDYIHYSVMMSIFNRQAFISAANLDRSQYNSMDGRSWFVDPRIGEEFQITNAAYKKNDWDRGHLTRLTAVTWGDSHISMKASNDSCSYANAALQHKNFNQDEWRLPEDIAADLEWARDGKVSIFTGPAFTEVDRWYNRRGSMELYRIPSFFWKLIAYIDKETDDLMCLGFLMPQNDLSILDRKGKKKVKIHLRNYQVSVTFIEQITGLEFSRNLFNSNPLIYYRAGENEDNEPEIFEMRSSKAIDEGDQDKLLRDYSKQIIQTRLDAEAEEAQGRMCTHINPDREVTTR
jgi:endonuclease G, mitochondrial